MEREEPLLLPETEKRGGGLTSKWELFVGELKNVSYISMPMVVVSVSQYLMRAASMMMLGHLGELALSSAAIATSLSNVTGFSLLSGMACALETLCGQAYGAGQFQKVGTFTYGSMIWLLLACIPVSILWIYTENILLLTGQDPAISAEAGKFSIWLIPSLFPYAILQSLIRYLQIQSLIIPMLFSTLATLCIHLPISWAFIFNTKLGSAGAALSIGLSYLLNVIFLGFYVNYSSRCAKTRTSFSKDVFYTFGEFFQFAIPSAVMVCLTIETIHFLVPYSFGAAASTRISNELGAGKAEAAQLVLSAVLFLSAVEFVIASSVIFSCRSILGYAFSNEKSIINYVKDMTPFLCMSIIMDSIQAVLSGVARGSGWQHVGAYVNLGAYYLVGIPVALVLGFVLSFKGEGLWSGLVAGAATQALLLGIITFRSDWDKQAKEARRRIIHQEIDDDGVDAYVT